MKCANEDHEETSFIRGWLRASSHDTSASQVTRASVAIEIVEFIKTWIAKKFNQQAQH